MNQASPGPMLVTLGVLLIVIGLLIWSGSLAWFGRLPGDIRIERESMHIYLPITSMVLVSIGFSAVLYLIRKLF